jgi:predicted HicB family RNase H-like nuclease
MEPVPPTTSNNLRVRLPLALTERLRELADENGVSMNTLLVSVIAGSVGFSLTPGREQDDDPAGAEDGA